MSLSRSLKTSTGRIYFALILLRIFAAFTGFGYIHPDEYFQNGEVTTGAVLHWHHLRTWEWDSTFPCRSILPPFVTTGLPLVVLNLITSGNVSSRAVFLLERLSTLLLSFILDVCVLQLVPIARSRALLLLASSHVVMTFQVRPFSNSIEACLVASSIAILGRMVASRHGSSSYTIREFATQTSWLAVIVVLGIMTRITFAAFVLPVAAEVLLFSVRLARASGCFSLGRWIKTLLIPLCTGIVALCGAIAIDTFYFSGEARRPVLTPYNNLLYNLSPDNLAKHGLHPRWLHVAVNLPLIVGPGLIFYGIHAARRVLTLTSKGEKQPSFIVVIGRTCIMSTVVSLVVLSLQPHQEPRFLTPLVVPFVVLVANSGYLENASRVFWVTWILGNTILSLLFGVLHQGGVIPSLLHINSRISTLPPSQNYIIVYWKTYMPPWHLLGIPETDILAGRASAADLAGRPSSDVAEYLSSLHARHLENTILYLVTPEFAMQGLDPSVSRCFSPDRYVYPHLDLDHLPESVEVGWPRGISLGIYAADLGCVPS